ncbi:FAD-dependent oxidoreductase [Rhodococcus gordoniae]|uniref:FAD-dependent oxidoreductase n=1 Tax=Rhodococcus gordoniae TaxID=223392 RepID=UPI0020CB7610|nr:FAD-dependent oxidoreductase [Rhodococcus gordoniae]UTT51008.1 FAD-dependent oxidoreductase [Rhodococcus gordoniae]
MSDDSHQWDVECDVVVVGSGAAALSAAVTAAVGGARVQVLEKEPVLGGTTGVSGGAIWIPNNRHLAPAGLQDSREDAASYIRHIAGGRTVDPHLIDVFVDTAPQMLDFLEAVTPLETQPVTNLHDYYETIRERVPGCKDFSRSVEPMPFPAVEELGEWSERLATRSSLLSLGADTTLKEDEAARGRGGPLATLEAMAERERRGIRVKGAALVGALLKTLLEHDVEVRLETTAQRLVMDDHDRVIGVRAETLDGPLRIRAHRGVVLACGGFEWDHDMVRAYIGYDVQPLSPGGNVGDGHRMAMRAGAQLSQMSNYWGQGAGFDPAIVGLNGKPFPQMMRGLGPGSIIVNRTGERFADGAITYNDFPKTFGNFDPTEPGYPNLPPAWVVFGQNLKREKAILSVSPTEDAPEWIIRAETIEELASIIGVDPVGLAASVDEENEAAERNGDSGHAGRILGPPYYAVQQWPGTLGTSGGCRINEHAQVLGERGQPIPGLYAAGNTAASALSGAYLGGGTPIAVGMTFGFLAGRHLTNSVELPVEVAAPGSVTM